MFDKIVFMLYALALGYKDLHYHAKGVVFWGVHKEADDGFDNIIDGFIDEIQEVCYLGREVEAISAKEIFDKSRAFVPEFPSDVCEHFKTIKQLLNETQAEITNKKPEMTDGENNLFMNIQQRLQQLNGFLWRNTLELESEKDADE